MPEPSDPIYEVNPKPKNIPQTNILPVLLIIGLFITIALVWLARPVSPPKKEEKHEMTATVVDKGADDTGRGWFNSEKYKNIRLAPTTEQNSPETIVRNEKILIRTEEAKYRQEVISQKYETMLEVLKLEQKNVLDEKTLEYAAMRAPLDIKVVPSPWAGVSADTMRTASEPAQETSLHDSVVPMAGTSYGNEKQDINRQDAKEEFIHRATDGDDYMHSVKRRALSPYELKAGTYIPAALINGIQSDLPGPVVAQVTQNVYDSATGKYLLVPQGSKLIGEYDSHVSLGQNRALVVWISLKFPDGSSIDLERMQGVDMAGYAGFHDKLDNHYLRIYGNALMLSLVGAGYEILNKKTSSDPVTAKDAVAASVGQRLADVSGQTMERNLSVQPTIVIRPGYKFNVVIVKDLVLEETGGF